MRLRILEISAGLVIFILCVAAFRPGVNWGWTTFIAFLAIALVVLEIAYTIRIFANSITGRRRLNLILSVLAILIALLALLAMPFFVSRPVFYGPILTIIYLLALGLLFAGIASAVRGTVGGKIVGIFGIFVGIIVLTSFKIAGILATFVDLALLISPDHTYPVNVAELVTASLTIFALQLIISGIGGRQIEPTRSAGEVGYTET